VAKMTRLYLGWSGPFEVAFEDGLSLRLVDGVVLRYPLAVFVDACYLLTAQGTVAGPFRAGLCGNELLIFTLDVAGTEN
jgi:hypothetical protein